MSLAAALIGMDHQIRRKRRRELNKTTAVSVMTWPMSAPPQLDDVPWQGYTKIRTN